MPIHVHYWCKQCWVHDMILQNRWLTTDKVAHQPQIFHGSAYEIIHNRLAFHKVCAWWFPKQLTELHKEKCLDICKWLLDRYGAEGDHFLEWIIKGDETWIHRIEPESTPEYGMETSSFAHQIKRNMHPTSGKLMLTVFWGLTMATTGTLRREGFNNEQCSLQWEAVWQAKACDLKRRKRTAVRRFCVVALQCLSSHCCPLLRTGDADLRF